MFPQADFVRPSGGLVPRQEPSGHIVGHKAVAVVRRATSCLWKTRHARWSLDEAGEMSSSDVNPRWSCSRQDKNCLADVTSADALNFDVQEAMNSADDELSFDVRKGIDRSGVLHLQVVQDSTTLPPAAPTVASPATTAVTWSDQDTLQSDSDLAAPQYEFIRPLPAIPSAIVNEGTKRVKRCAVRYDFDVAYLLKMTYKDGDNTSSFSASSLSRHQPQLDLLRVELIAVHGDERMLPQVLEISPEFHREALDKTWHQRRFEGNAAGELQYGCAIAQQIKTRAAAQQSHARRNPTKKPPHHHHHDFLVFGGCRLVIPGNPARKMLDDPRLLQLRLSVKSFAEYVDREEMEGGNQGATSTVGNSSIESI
ncbi:hypothetical protein PWT90_08719 [Aphanocladium album]|nr:hypothetical protein PWT90_08719 [Aphanocladium album]